MTDRIVGIVGSEEMKFTAAAKTAALQIIHNLLLNADEMVSGGCHLGGIDIWAEEAADTLGIKKSVFKPARLCWNGGYRERNILIAERSTEVHCITVKTLPEGFKGMRFARCYHCNTDEHVKSGGCWTAIHARKLGKQVFWHVVSQDGEMIG